MTYLTVGHLSAIIAAGIAILQFLLPNALVLILVSVLSDNHTAVTWSVAGRSLGNSLWPLFLNADTAASKNVSTKVKIVTWLRPVSLAFIAIAAVVTPIGLHETVVLSPTTQMVSFAYIRDVGPMGYGTSPRSNLGFSRSCGNFLPRQCPGTTVQIIYSDDGDVYNATIPGDDYDRRIPRVLANLYQSGLSQQRQTVSSFFDIQSRQYNLRTRNNIGNNTYSVISYRPLTSFVLDDTIQPVEGLIVDTHVGGVAFRNHSAPTSLGHTAEWDEDLLFLEPETACVNTNLTLEIQVPAEGVYASTFEAPSYVVDQGGFVNINKTSPFTYSMYHDTQTNPMLTERAYSAAWAMNVLNMYYLNITKPGRNRSAYMNSEIGKRFATNSTFGYQDMHKLTTTTNYNGILAAPDAYLNGTTNNVTIAWHSGVYPNPFNINYRNFSYIGPLCQGFDGLDLVNLTNIGVQCGLVLGVGQRIDRVDSLFAESGSWWTRPIYSCASATKASIKNVRFRFNATSSTGFKNLEVLNVTQKIYPNQSAMPLWGVETAKLRIFDISPLWGLIDSSMEHSVNLSTIRSDSLYLPASKYSLSGQLWPGDGFEFMPAASVPADAWGSTYSTDAGGSKSDYTGATNLQLYLKWRDLSRNTSGAAEILNIIWTDYSANALVGTRSWMSGNQLPPNLQKRQTSAGSPDQTAPQVPVYIYQPEIQYRWVFGIPAALSLLIVGIVCLVAFGSILSGRGTPARVRHYMWNLSAGRLLTSFVYPEEEGIVLETKTWVRQVGSKNIRILESSGTTILKKKSDRSHTYQEVHQTEMKDGTRETVHIL